MWKFLELLGKIFNVVIDFVCIVIIALALMIAYGGFKVNAKEPEVDEMVLLQQVALAEAGNQGIGGMAFVMQVIYNRVEDDRFPDNITDVIMQENQLQPYLMAVI